MPRSFLIVAVVAISAWAISAKVHAVDRPNVLIFLADDAGWGDYSRNGNKQVSTPHIDSIAEQGVTLDRFYVCPVCAPTRAEFLTGRYHSRTGVYGVSIGQERMDLDERTIADAFKSAGYATGAFGKWHNGSQWPYHPMARGFDEYFGHTAGHWGEYFDPPLEHNGKLIRARGYIVDACTDQAIDFIERNHQKPFFCYVPFTTPHSPWAVPNDDWQRFRDKPIPQRSSQPKDEVLDETRCALAMIENQDRNVGRILDQLASLRIAENTIVLYFSDNGPNTFRWNGDMKGKKGTTDEGGVRSTCFIRWPKKLPSNQIVEPITGAIDLLPTLVSLAGIDRVGDKPLDGLDLSPLLLGQTNDWPKRKIFSTWAGKCSVRTDSHRLDDKGQLFDMLADPAQTHPLASGASGVQESLAKAVNQWRSEMGGTLTAGMTDKQRNGGVDPRPIHVGYREFPMTWLPARDANPNGNIQRSSSAPNCSYFVNWKSKEDFVGWDIIVNKSGLYRIELLYTCPMDDAGSTIEVSFNEQRLTGKVSPGWDPPLYNNQDTLPRPAAESRMKEFRTLDLGTMTLNKGAGDLIIRATDIPGKRVMDLRAIMVTLLE